MLAQYLKNFTLHLKSTVTNLVSKATWCYTVALKLPRDKGEAVGLHCLVLCQVFISELIAVSSEYVGQ